MIKALARKAVILGLSDMNIKMLRQDKPIKINLSELGLPDQEIVIITGKDEVTMAKMLTGYGINNVN